MRHASTACATRAHASILPMTTQRQIYRSKFNDNDNSAWLYTIPNIIPKEDEELHETLMKERKEAHKAKAIQICQEELTSILKYAFYRMENKEDKKSKQKGQVLFLNGDFIESTAQEVPTEEEEKVEQTSSREVKDLYPCLKRLLDDNNSGHNEAFREFSRQSLKAQFTYDPNSTIDAFCSFLDNAQRSFSLPFEKNKNPPSIPAIICIVGAPGTGKTTIAQFLSKLYDFSIFNVDDEDQDEKVLMAAITDAIIELKSTQGLLIVNYPQNKTQLPTLEKTIFIASKMKRPCGTQSPQTISGMIHCTMTYADVTHQNSGCSISANSGFVFHETFCPPVPCLMDENDTDLEPAGSFQVSNSDFEEYRNLFSQVIQLYSKSQNCQILEIPLIQSIWNLLKRLETFLRNFAVDPNFQSALIFPDESSYFFSKMCGKILDIWKEQSMPLFSDILGGSHLHIQLIDKKISYFSQITKERFFLMTSMTPPPPPIKRTRPATVQAKIHKISRKRGSKPSEKNQANAIQMNELAQFSKSTANLQLNSRESRFRPKHLQPLNITESQEVFAPPLSNTLKMKIHTPIYPISSPFHPLVDQSNIKADFSKTLPKIDSNNYRNTLQSNLGKNPQGKRKVLTNITKKNQNPCYNKKDIKNAFETAPDEIWKWGNTQRDKNLKLVDEIINSSPLQRLGVLLDEGEAEFFSALISRFLIIDWFFMTYHLVRDRKQKMLYLPTPNLPPFNPEHLRELIDVMKLHQRKVIPRPTAINKKKRIMAAKSLAIYPVSAVSQKSITEGFAALERVNSSKELPTLIPLTTQSVILPFPEKIKFDQKTSSTYEEKFLEYVRGEVSRKLLKEEIIVLQKMLYHHHEERKIVSQKLETEIAQLRNSLYEWVFIKNSREMEVLKRNNSFFIDIECLSGRCQELYQTLKGDIHPLKLSGKKLTIFTKGIQNILDKNSEQFENQLSIKDPSFIHTGSLEEVIEVGKKAQLNEEELARLELVIRLSPLPDFLDLDSLLSSITSGTFLSL